MSKRSVVKPIFESLSLFSDHTQTHLFFIESGPTRNPAQCSGAGKAEIAVGDRSEKEQAIASIEYIPLCCRI